MYGPVTSPPSEVEAALGPAPVQAWNAAFATDPNGAKNNNWKFSLFFGIAGTEGKDVPDLADFETSFVDLPLDFVRRTRNALIEGEQDGFKLNGACTFD